MGFAGDDFRFLTAFGMTKKKVGMTEGREYDRSGFLLSQE